MNKKLVELRLATLLEQALTKDEILERYLNAIYLGNGVYGVEGAAQDLFGNGVSDVTLAEAAILAALPKAPSVYTLCNNLERALTRRNIELGILARALVVDSAAVSVALRAPLSPLSKRLWNRLHA